MGQSAGDSSQHYTAPLTTELYAVLVVLRSVQQ